MREDEYWALRDDVSSDDIPIAELSDETRKPPARRGRRSRRVAASVLVLALGTFGLVVAAHITDDHAPPRRNVAPGPPRAIKTISPAQARVDVLTALSATTATGSFKVHSHLSETQGSGASQTSESIVADGTVNVHPTVIVATSTVGGSRITARINGTDVWEAGGGYYGMAPGGASGPGAPLSQFSSLVMSSLGPREGAVAMNGMASPTGDLELAENAITDASSLGDGVVDGIPVHDYQVNVDATKVLDRPDLTTEEIKAASAALAVLQSEGYRTTTVKLAIDATGLIRHTQTAVRFADGGSVDIDVTFSAFGCSTIVQRPDGPWIVPAPGGACA